MEEEEEEKVKEEEKEEEEEERRGRGETRHGNTTPPLDFKARRPSLRMALLPTHGALL